MSLDGTVYPSLLISGADQWIAAGGSLEGYSPCLFSSLVYRYTLASSANIGPAAGKGGGIQTAETNVCKILAQGMQEKK
jgi:hypothetical protein